MQIVFAIAAALALLLGASTAPNTADTSSPGGDTSTTGTPLHTPTPADNVGGISG